MKGYFIRIIMDLIYQNLQKKYDLSLLGMST